MELYTERLILRPWREADAEDLYGYAKDPAVGPAAGWPPHKGVQESREVIKNVLSGKECYAVCLKSDNKVIGAIELILNGGVEEAKREDACELGYWIGQAFWGQGLIPEAANALLLRAFEDLHMKIVWCRYYEGNTKSKRVQEKLGFIYHHTSVDALVPLLGENRTEYANCMTKEQWEAKQH